MEVVNKENYKCFGNNAILNKPSFHSVAAISYEINSGNELDEFDKKSWINNDAILQISDCNRSISLDFAFGNEDYENSLYKINLLKNMLNEFSKDLEEARNFYLELKSKQDLMTEDDGNNN